MVEFEIEARGLLTFEASLVYKLLYFSSRCDKTLTGTLERKGFAIVSIVLHWRKPRKELKQEPGGRN